MKIELTFQAFLKIFKTSSITFTLANSLEKYFIHIGISVGKVHMYSLPMAVIYIKYYPFTIFEKKQWPCVTT